MNEILIEGKKYLSSKQAAKITGYAKDYIGQLCREGRVKARLVGRSWYVLESAIHEHRFGTKEVRQEEPKITRETASSGYTLPSTWKEPKYEPAPVTVLPPIQQRPHAADPEPEEPVAVSIRKEPEEPPKEESTLTDVWHSWFKEAKNDMITETVLPRVPDSKLQNEKKGFDMERVREEAGEAETSVPIRAIYSPMYSKSTVAEVQAERAARMPADGQKGRRHHRRHRGRALVIILGIVALASVIFAVISSGIIDQYIISFNQASIVTGINSYIK